MKAYPFVITHNLHMHDLYAYFIRYVVIIKANILIIRDTTRCKSFIIHVPHLEQCTRCLIMTEAQRIVSDKSSWSYHHRFSSPFTLDTKK